MDENNKMKTPEEINQIVMKVIEDGSIKYDSDLNEFYSSSSDEVSILPQIIWHITDRCFLSCPYCFATKLVETELDKIDDSMEVFKKLGVQK